MPYRCRCGRRASGSASSRFARRRAAGSCWCAAYRPVRHALRRRPTDAVPRPDRALRRGCLQCRSRPIRRRTGAFRDCGCRAAVRRRAGRHRGKEGRQHRDLLPFRQQAQRCGQFCNLAVRAGSPPPCAVTASTTCSTRLRGPKRNHRRPVACAPQVAATTSNAPTSWCSAATSIRTPLMTVLMPRRICTPKVM